MRSALIRLDQDDGVWRDHEDVADLIQSFIRGEESEEFSNVYQGEIRKMDDKNIRFFATYQPKPIFDKRNINWTLYQGIVPNIQTALRKYPHVLNHSVFDQF